MTEAEARAMTDQPAAAPTNQPGPWQRDAHEQLKDADGYIVTFRNIFTYMGTEKVALAQAIANTDLAIAAPATADERDRLLMVNEGLVKALEFFFQALDEEWLIRNIEKDAEPDWAIKSMPWVQGFAKAINTLDEARKP